MNPQTHKCDEIMLQIDSSRPRILQELVELYKTRAARYYQLALHVFHQQPYRSPAYSGR